MFTIVVRERGNETIVDTIGESSTERGLERTLRGVQINMNHDEYFADIEDKDAADKELADGSK